MDNKKINLRMYNKKAIFFSVLAILIIFIFVFCIIQVRKSNDKSVEEKVLTYLNNKYNQEFEIVQLINQSQYEEPAISCDGTVIFPSKKIDDKFEYLYKIKSVQDDVNFDIYFLTDEKEDIFKDSYIVYKNIDKTINDISSYILANINDVNVNIQDEISQRGYSLNYDCNITINSNQNLNDILDENYKNNLQNIRRDIYNLTEKFENNYNASYNKESDGNIFFNVIIQYKDNRYIQINQPNTLYIHENDSNSGLDINSYLKKLNNS